MLSRLIFFKLHDYMRHVYLQRNNIFKSGARCDLFKNSTKSVKYLVYEGHPLYNESSLITKKVIDKSPCIFHKLVIDLFDVN